MTTLLYLLTICLPLAVVLVIFTMKYRADGRQAQARILEETAYRDLAQKAASAGTQTATAMSAVQGDLSEIKARLAAVEKILKAVE